MKKTLLALASIAIIGCTGSTPEADDTGKPIQSTMLNKSSQWVPPKVAITIRLNDMEVRYIKGDLDEDSFDRLILKADPDIGRVKYHPRTNEDHDDIENSKRDFRRALYFAKKIPLANGQTMFDWLKSCPFSMGENMYASKVPAATGAYESFSSKLSFMDATYHPVLSMRGLGRKDDISLSWIIYEDGTLKSFTSRASIYLNNPDFETQSSTECRT